MLFSLSCLGGVVGLQLLRTANSSIHPLLSPLSTQPRWLNCPITSPLTTCINRPVLIHCYNPSDITAQHVIDRINQAAPSINDYCTQIGIHCPIYNYDSSNVGITAFIDEHRPIFPFVVDNDRSLQKHFNVHKLPCSLLLLPDQKEAVFFDTLSIYDSLEQTLLALISKYPPHPTEVALPQPEPKETTLLFPVKIDYVKNYEDAPALLIADSGHHRILVARTDGTIVTQIGSGIPDLKDGNFEEACFNRPHGVLYDDTTNRLFIADRYNHTLRVVDLTKKTVTTAAGNGTWGHTHMVASANIPRSTPLSAPYDLSFFMRRDFIVIAQPSTHTLWGYESISNRLRPLIGNGLNALKIGKPPYNSIMQPTGLCLKRGELLLVDAAAHALCSLQQLDVKPLVGNENTDYGFSDGSLTEARLHYPCGTATNQKDIFIADTYNHAIRSFDQKTGTLTTICGTGKPGTTISELKTTEFNAPKGLVAVDDMLYVADTNNHRIVTIDTKTNTSSVLELRILP